MCHCWRKTIPFWRESEPCSLLFPQSVKGCLDFFLLLSVNSEVHVRKEPAIIPQEDTHLLMKRWIGFLWFSGSLNFFKIVWGYRSFVRKGYYFFLLCMFSCVPDCLVFYSIAWHNVAQTSMLRSNTLCQLEIIQQLSLNLSR